MSFWGWPAISRNATHYWGLTCIAQMQGCLNVACIQICMNVYELYNCHNHARTSTEFRKTLGPWIICCFLVWLLQDFANPNLGFCFLLCAHVKEGRTILCCRHKSPTFMASGRIWTERVQAWSVLRFGNLPSAKAWKYPKIAATSVHVVARKRNTSHCRPAKKVC